MNERRNYVTKQDGSIAFLLAVALSMVGSVVVSLFLLAAGKGVEEANYWLLIIPAQVVLLAAGVGYIVVCRINITPAIGLKRKIKAVNVALLALLSLSVILFMNPIQNWFLTLLESFGYATSAAELDVAAFSVGDYIFAFLFVCIFPAVSEELMYRGLAMEGLRTKRFDGKAILLSAVCFTLMHMSALQLVHPLVMGLILGFVYSVTNSIWNTVILHLFNNLFVVIISSIGALNVFVAENWWLMFPALGVIVAALFLFWHKRDRTELEIPAEKIESNSKGSLIWVPMVICAAMIVADLFL
jgi:membrane protease YdiL (CAAX protease family)